MSSGRKSNKKKPGSKKKSSSNSWLTPLIAILVLIGLGAGVWLVVPKLFSKGNQHVALLQDMYAKERAQLEIRESMTNGPTAQAALGAYQKALEAQIAATNSWVTYMQQNPADLATRNALRQEIAKHKKDVFDLNVTISKQYTPGSGADIQGIESELQKVQELLNGHGDTGKAAAQLTLELSGQAQQDAAASAAQRPAPSADSRTEHIARLNAKWTAIRARLEIRKSMVDAASARAAIDRYRQAIEAEIAAIESWQTYMRDNPPDEATRNEMLNFLNSYLPDVAVIEQEIQQVSNNEQAINQELKPLESLIERMSIANLLSRQMELPLYPTPVAQAVPSTINMPSPGDTAPTQRPPTGEPVSAVSPPTEPPVWEEPPETQFSREHGKLAVRIRILGVPFGAVSQVLTSGPTAQNPGPMKFGTIQSSQASFLEVAPILDFEALVTKLESFGKVLQSDQDKRVIVFWANPEMLNKASQVGPTPSFPGGSGAAP